MPAEIESRLVVFCNQIYIMNILCRESTNEDLEEILLLERRQCPSLEEQWTVEHFQKHINLLAFADSLLIGILSYYFDERGSLHIANVQVHPKFSLIEISTKLLEFLCKDRTDKLVVTFDDKVPFNLYCHFLL